MQDIPILKGLRHRWCWERRPRLHIQSWSYSKIPRACYSPEDSCRPLSVYLRPWCLYAADATDFNPSLSNLNKAGLYTPFLECTKAARTDTSSAHAYIGIGYVARTDTSSAHDPPRESTNEITTGPPKRRRLAKKTKMPASVDTPQNPTSSGLWSYIKAWEEYAQGNIISETATRCISNMLAANAAHTPLKNQSTRLTTPTTSSGNIFLSRMATWTSFGKLLMGLLPAVLTKVPKF